MATLSFLIPTSSESYSLLLVIEHGSNLNHKPLQHMDGFINASHAHETHPHIINTLHPQTANFNLGLKSENPLNT